MRLALIAALLFTLAACASQTKNGSRGPTPTTYPTLAPWIPTVTPTTIPYATAAPGTMPHVDGLLYLRSLDGTVSALNPADGATRWSVAS